MLWAGFLAKALTYSPRLPVLRLAEDSDLRCGFRRHYSGGTAPDFHRSSLTPRASKYRNGSYIEKNALSSLIFLHCIRTTFILPIEKLRRLRGSAKRPAES